MSKPTTEATKKLMNLLYSSTTSQISASKSIISDVTTPKISRMLYNDQEPTTTIPSTSNIPMTFDNISSKLKIPSENALLSLWPNFRSNILQFKCPNSYITKYDFWKLIPNERNCKYNLKLNPTFEIIKKRNNQLDFMNEYYLIFENQLNACVYIKETEGKLINGIKLNFEFIELNKKILESMNFKKISDFNKINGILNLNEKVVGVDEDDKDLMSNIKFDNFEVLKNWLNVDKRENYVIVRNWPFGLNESSVFRLLWNYDLINIIDVVSDVTNEKRTVLLEFNNFKDANRFIRNYHGRKWDYLQGKSNKRHKETIFYQPLLCEKL